MQCWGDTYVSFILPLKIALMTSLILVNINTSLISLFRKKLNYIYTIVYEQVILGQDK